MARPAGSLNKATIEKQIIAAQLIDRARTLNEPLAKEKLIELIGIAMAAMAAHQPVSEEVAKRERERGNRKARAQKGSWRMFGEWFDRAAYVCKSLIPYQSPALKAIAIAPVPPPETAGQEEVHEFRLRVYEGGRIVKTVSSSAAPRGDED